MNFVFFFKDNPLSKKFNDKTFLEDVKEIVESKKLSKDDVNMLLSHMLFSKLSSEGKTYAEILQAAKTEKTKQEQLQAVPRFRKSNPFKDYVDRDNEIVDSLIKNRKYLN